MILVTDDFYKNVPIEHKEQVMRKLEYFRYNIIENKNKIKDMPKGFWIKKINNTDIYKFRLNNSDRVLFTFIENKIDYVDNRKDVQENILLLDYCKHDKQIERGKRINIKASKNKANLFKIYKDVLDEDYDQEDFKNKYVQNYIKYNHLDLNDYVAFVVNDRYLAVLLDSENSDYLYYLSDEQFQCLKSIEKPIMLSGSAGSGKTTVAFHKLFWCYNNNYKTGYFTFTDLLCENARTAFNKFSCINGGVKPEFFSMNKFYSQILKIDCNKIVKYSMFNRWYSDNKYRYNFLKKIDGMDIWTEIRGIIKGYIGLEGKNIKDICNSNEMCIPLDVYLNIPDSYSIFEDNQKKIIYKICQDYQSWIKEEGLYDENELTIEVLQQINENEKYDFVIVDEIQDLSEIQLYMISKLTKNPNNIMFSGDIHQIVNPTFFSFGRLKNIYYGQVIELNEFTLTKNYRNTDAIVNVLNRLTEERKRLIGSSKYDYEEKYIREGKPVQLIAYTSKSIKELLEMVKDKHYCAVVVLNEEEKRILLEIDNEASGRIFTVSEIKGLEYENIYCINIISSNIEAWREMYSGFGKKKSKYRYYFNQLYVSVSRAKKNLYLYENCINCDILNSISDYIELSKEYDEETLNLIKKSSKKDWAGEAERLEMMDRIDKSQLARNKSLEDMLLKHSKVNEKYSSDIYEDIQIVKISDSNSKLDKLLNKGYKYFQKRKYRKAIEYYEEALKIEPNNYKVYYNIANAYSYISFSGMENSLKYFDECISLNNEFYLAYIDKAAILNSLERTTEKITLLEKAIEIDPNCSNAYMMLAKTYLEQSNFKEAEYYSQKALDLDGYVWDVKNHFWEKVKRGSDKDIFFENIKSMLEDSQNKKSHEPLSQIAFLKPLEDFLTKALLEMNREN